MCVCFFCGERVKEKITWMNGVHGEYTVNMLRILFYYFSSFNMFFSIPAVRWNVWVLTVSVCHRVFAKKSFVFIVFLVYLLAVQRDKAIFMRCLTPFVDANISKAILNWANSVAKTKWDCLRSCESMHLLYVEHVDLYCDVFIFGVGLRAECCVLLLCVCLRMKPIWCFIQNHYFNATFLCSRQFMHFIFIKFSLRTVFVDKPRKIPESHLLFLICVCTRLLHLFYIRKTVARFVFIGVVCCHYQNLNESTNIRTHSRTTNIHTL